MFMQWYCGGMASVAIIRRSDKARLFIEKDSVVMMMIVVMVKMMTTMIMVMMTMITVMPIIRRIRQGRSLHREGFDALGSSRWET